MDRQLINQVVFSEPLHYRWLDFACVVILCGGIAYGAVHSNTPSKTQTIPTVQFLPNAPIKQADPIQPFKRSLEVI